MLGDPWTQEAMLKMATSQPLSTQTERSQGSTHNKSTLLLREQSAECKKKKTTKNQKPKNKRNSLQGKHELVSEAQLQLLPPPRMMLEALSCLGKAPAKAADMRAHGREVSGIP